jgi:hypothetical protein
LTTDLKLFPPALSWEACAFDYDGTLARDGVVAVPTIEALRRLRTTGKKLLLVTGRRLDDLLRIFAHAELFERIIAENGGLLYRPQTGDHLTLSVPPPEKFVALLQARGVQPLEFGYVVVATREPQQSAVLQAIKDLGLELQLIFNKGAVMILPSGVNKATGLKTALKELQLLPEQVIAVGDAENDHAFLELCGFGVAVANALPALKEHADFVTTSANGAGIMELVDHLMANQIQPSKAVVS